MNDIAWHYRCTPRELYARLSSRELTQLAAYVSVLSREAAE